ncbi:type IV pili methyl-accepting chemotaxis transducer N-terminal domain-containing protein [Halomonas sp. HP20-15]|uniref:type IV pili methyl-accepting chemotaxis transducer N-terminal domain-containing protein n=1 Tax=Halomonas sp. HP20-15 TaxID=3085901 RepID=UPI002981E51E|nr:type IV pili methyl-accepting chemotaxis transducer N-terminal domain-containing protein [Halomonas sp. HP20-15]MDW5375634.1 type IV pili methyl-accepting chemotaxis transducer N-terminal domain-containing protein [Halomonas sp. HP20-15]
MSQSITRSLIFRAGLTMAGIVILALTSMLGSILIAETSSGDAAAINKAGALRMQAYRLLSTRLQEPVGNAALRQQLERFDASLTSPVIASLIPDDPRHPLADRYAAVTEMWQGMLRPALLTGEQRPPPALNAQVGKFVSEVDSLVGQLQQEAESRVQMLRLFQGIVLFLTLILVFVAMYKLISDIVPPLRELFHVINRVRHGDFEGRVDYAGNDELGLISHTINQMNESLSHMYAELEQRVEAKTAELKRSNESLRLLYQAARQLNSSTPGSEDFRDVLEHLEKVTGLGPITLCLSQDDAERAYQRISTQLGDRPDFCQAPDCGPCLSGERVPAQVRPVVVSESDRRYGVLLMRYPKGTPPLRWQMDLVETVAGLIATTLSLGQINDEQRRLALMDERAVIARELHDSLAQSLSYLKIQVVRLQQVIRLQRPAAEQEAIIDELREGLSSAYRQLRELLNTFRLKMTEPGLEAALNETVREFAQRSKLKVLLEYELRHCPLTPNEEIHVLQIVREALSNVVHHAQAENCDIHLQTTESGQVRVCIRDDGVGLAEQHARPNHYGTTIMSERAAGLGGTLDMHNRAGGGAEVELCFTPQVTAGSESVTLLGGT